MQISKVGKIPANYSQTKNLWGVGYDKKNGIAVRSGYF